jgi:hypothetical protein
MNIARTQDWRRTPQPPNGLYVGFYSISRTRLKLHSMYMAPFCSPISATQRPRDFHHSDLPAHERSMETRAFPIVRTYSNERTGLPV